MINTPIGTEPLQTAHVLRAVLASDLQAFTEHVFAIVRPGIPFRPNWHVEAITHKLAEVAEGRIKRLIITLPPRSLKSLCASVALPAWFLGRHPEQRVVAVSYSDVLARTHANDFRAVVTDPLYQAAFPQMRVARDSDREVTTTRRGKRIATSIEGSLTGLGGNLVVIDDPIKLGDIYSQVVRERVIEWYRSTLLSRADDKTDARIVVVMQRVHQNDLVGYLQEQGGYQVLNLPAIAPCAQTYDLGHGRAYSRQRRELLHPDHEPASALAELKRTMGPIAFSAQYQQTPIPLAGNIIKRQWLKTSEENLTQRDQRVIISWDIALSEGGDYSVGVVLLNVGETFSVIDVIRGRFTFVELKRRVIEVNRRYHRPTLVIEESPIGLGLIQSLREQRVNVIGYRPTTDKIARVVAQTDLFAGGSILFPPKEKAVWLEGLVAELLAFPGGRHDDQVDALIQGIDWGRSTPIRRVHVGAILGTY